MIQLLLDSIRFVSEHLELLEQRATASAGKPELSLCGIAKKCRPSFFLGSLFGSCLDCFLIFVLTSHECVTVFINFSLILLCFLLCLVLIFRSRKSSWLKPTACNFFFTIDVTMKEINWKHNASCFNFYFYTVFVVLRNQVLRNNFDFCLSDAAGISA